MDLLWKDINNLACMYVSLGGQESMFALGVRPPRLTQWTSLTYSRPPGVAAADYVNTSYSLPLAHPFKMQR